MIATIIFAALFAGPPGCGAQSRPDVVVIPALLGGNDAFRRVAGALEADGYRVVFAEPIGFGDAARPADADYSLAAQATRIAMAMDSLCVRGALVIGHSIGAGIAMRVAAAHPEMVRSVLAIEGGGAESAMGPGARAMLALAPLWRYAGRTVMRRQVQRDLMSRSMNHAWVTDSLVDRYVASLNADIGATLDAMRSMSRAREPYRLTDRMAAMRCSVVVLAAGFGGTIPAFELAAMRSRIPGLVHRVVEGTGHFIHEERPEAVVAAARDLLQSPAITLTASNR